MTRLMTQRSSRSLNSTGGSSVSSGFGGGAYGGAAGAGAGSPARRLSNVNAGTSLPSINSIYWSDTFDFPGPGAYQPDSSTEVLQSTPPSMCPCSNASPNHLLVTMRTSADSQGITTVGIWHWCALKVQQGMLCAWFERLLFHRVLAPAPPHQTSGYTPCPCSGNERSVMSQAPTNTSHSESLYAKMLAAATAISLRRSVRQAPISLPAVTPLP